MLYFQPLALIDWNGIPRGYNIYYRMKLPEVDASFIIIKLENGMDIESYFLVRLEEWVEYEVKMNSYNDAGTSGFSPITSERTRESGQCHLTLVHLYLQLCNKNPQWAFILREFVLIIQKCFYHIKKQPTPQNPPKSNNHDFIYSLFLL